MPAACCMSAMISRKPISKACFEEAKRGSGHSGSDLLKAPDLAGAPRAVTSTDGMTADYYPFDRGFLGRVKARIINEARGINRVTDDIASKPPRTIEWPAP